MSDFFYEALQRRFTDNDFRSVLRDIAVRTGVSRHQKRPSNATDLGITQVGELIEPENPKEFIKALNREVQARNTAFQNSPHYVNLKSVQAATLTKFQTSKIVDATDWTKIQEILESLVSDKIRNFSQAVPTDFLQVRQNQKTIFLSLGEKLARLEFIVSNVANIRTGVRVTYNHTQNWFSDGRSSVNRNYNDLRFILGKINTNEVNDIKVGIANFVNKRIKWFNNIKLTASTLRFQELNNPDNRNKTMKKQVISGYLDFSINQEIEDLVAERLKGAIITAARYNKYKELLNNAERACLCDCNYCTCDCNYCTCDCNYCTCNCNYCTCDCNYCTCDCNYCTCNNNREYTDRINTFSGTLCTCNTDTYISGYGRYGGIYYGHRNTYLQDCSCNNDRSVPVRNRYGNIVYYTCSCNSNMVKRVVQQSTVTQVCTCNVDKQWTRNITGSSVWYKSSTGQIDNNVITNTNNTSKGTTVRVCVCDTNVTIRETCNTNKTMSYRPNIGSNAYICACNINRNRTVVCAANREYRYVTDFNSFAGGSYLQNCSSHKNKR